MMSGAMFKRPAGLHDPRCCEESEIADWPVPECSRWVVFPHINGTDKKVRESAADSRTPSASGLTPPPAGPGPSQAPAMSTDKEAEANRAL